MHSPATCLFLNAKALGEKLSQAFYWYWPTVINNVLVNSFSVFPVLGSVLTNASRIFFPSEITLERHRKLEKIQEESLNLIDEIPPYIFLRVLISLTKTLSEEDPKKEEAIFTHFFLTGRAHEALGEIELENSSNSSPENSINGECKEEDFEANKSSRSYLSREQPYLTRAQRLVESLWRYSTEAGSKDSLLPLPPPPPERRYGTFPY
ncbi:hypothetical protein [Coxiella burnetii]|uniref:hypothetical protein n=1 Tax=Coxiella burnetii TaxID=777 RepID=UPI0002D62EE5|nr:hypothetical protein [Coxiella burnetii]